MKTMKRLALASLVLVLSACGGGEGGGETAKPGTASTTTTVAPASAASDLRKALASARIQAATPEQAADQLLNFAQSSVYADLFPGNPTTQSYPPFRYRAYSNGVLLGVVVTDGMGYTMNGVYVMGGEFGDSPVYVGLVNDFVTLTEPSDLLVFSPSLLKVTGYAGETREVEFTANATQTLSDVGNIAVLDATGRFSRVSSTPTFTPGEYSAKLRLSDSLPVGEYSGLLEVRLCRDSATVCANQYAGSPVQLPYQLTIVPATDLKPLRALPGAAAWNGLNGNPAGNAYVAAQVRPEAFSRRFKWKHTLGYGTPGLAIADGRVISMDTSFGTIRAHSEASGQVAWESKPAGGTWEGPPAVQNGRVFAVSAGESSLFAFDIATGKEVGRYPLGATQGRFYLNAPVVMGGKVFTSSNRRVNRHDATTGAADWSREYPSSDGWGMAANATQIFGFNGLGLSVFNVSDGTLFAQVADPNHEGLDRAPVVLDGSDAYVVHRGRLKKFDTARAAVAWEVRATNWYGGPGFSNPVIADGVLYVTTGSRLEARSISTGAVQWYWQAPHATTGQLVIVGGHAFVGTAVETYAIDLSTHKSVWSYPAAGVLAVSQNGILYIAPPGSLVAINLH